MTTQQDDRARLIKGLRDLRDVDFDDLFVKAAALLEADAKGGEAECIDCKGTGLRDSGGTMPWGEPAYVPCDCQSNPQTQAQAQAGLEATDSERNRRIYDAATHAAAIAVFMTRMDAEHPDADDKGVSGWLEEAEERVKQRASQSLGATLNNRPQQAAQVPLTDEFAAWYWKACESSQPSDWMKAALAAQRILKTNNPAGIGKDQG